MKKRIVAAFVLVALVFGLLPGLTPEVSAAKEDRFLVGYSKQDMNPWIQSSYTGGLGIADRSYPDSNHIVNVEVTDTANTAKTKTVKMVAVPLAGYSSAATRWSGILADDNNDGIVGLGDGVFTTCTAVTDYLGNTILYITYDGIGAMDQIVRSVKNAIPAAIRAVGGNISGSNIMFSTSHSHEGVDYDFMKSNMTSGSAWEAFYNYSVDQIVKAAVEAYQDRREAAMTKGAVDAKDATAALGYNDGKGLLMNGVRQYYMINGYGMDSDGRPTSRTFMGSNEFNNITYIIKRANGETDRYNGGSVPFGAVAEANDTMYLLRFKPTDGADPIVLVNWRAHPSFLGGIGERVISSDYINSLRHGMEEKGYRVAFFQGAAGNINPRNRASSDSWHNQTGWKGTVSGENTAQRVARECNNCNIYGGLLAEIALYGLHNSMTQELAGGTIRLKHTNFEAERTTGSVLHQPIDVIGLGTDVMIVVGAGEYFDRYDSNYATNYKATYQKYIYGNYYRSTSINTKNPAQLTNGKDKGLDTSKYTTNEWDKLVDNDTYGTPFFFGYSSTRNGYVPNTMAFEYNSELTGDYKTTPKLEQLVDVNNTPDDTSDDTYYVPFQTYSYEAAPTSCGYLKKGEGERIIDTMAQMCKEVGDAPYNKVAKCEHCGITVTWSPLKPGFAEELTISSGHYYLKQDLIGSNVRGKLVSGNVCLDMNDKTFAPTYKNAEGDLRGTPFILEAGAELNIMDNGEDASKVGTLIGVGDGDYNGGVVSVHGPNAVFNLYNGNMRYDGVKDTVDYGGAVYVNKYGTFNMYGGTVQGGNVSGDGGTVYVSGEANFNMYGGRLIAGSAAADGDCVYLENGAAYISLAGDARVDDICFSAASANTEWLGQLSVSGEFAGKANITLDDSRVKFSAGMNIGSSDNATIPTGAISYVHTDGVRYEVTVSGSSLKLTKMPTAFVVMNANGTSAGKFDTITSALNSYSSGGTTPETATKYIRLFGDVTENITFNSDLYLDLNGYKITGIITMQDNSTLYCMDSYTDDYDIDDGWGYAVITGKVNGNLEGLPVGSPISPNERAAGYTPYHAGYLKIEEENNGNTEISFHRVDLGLTHINFRPDDLGISYSSNFSGDQLVKKHVKKFGVAVSIVEAPDAGNLDTKCGYSELSSFEAGAGINSAKSTRLVKIMQESNYFTANKANAEKKIYGRAYLLTDSGYIFGTVETSTLRQIVEKVDTKFSETINATLKENTVAMYKTFENVMSEWDIDNIKAVAKEGS